MSHHWSYWFSRRTKGFLVWIAWSVPNFDSYTHSSNQFLLVEISRYSYFWRYDLHLSQGGPSTLRTWILSTKPSSVCTSVKPDTEFHLLPEDLWRLSAFNTKPKVHSTGLKAQTAESNIDWNSGFVVPWTQALGTIPTARRVSAHLTVWKLDEELYTYHGQASLKHPRVTRSKVRWLWYK